MRIRRRPKCVNITTMADSLASRYPDDKTRKEEAGTSREQFREIEGERARDGTTQREVLPEAVAGRNALVCWRRTCTPYCTDIFRYRVQFTLHRRVVSSSLSRTFVFTERTLPIFRVSIRWWSCREAGSNCVERIHFPHFDKRTFDFPGTVRRRRRSFKVTHTEQTHPQVAVEGI